MSRNTSKDTILTNCWIITDKFWEMAYYFSICTIYSRKLNIASVIISLPSQNVSQTTQQDPNTTFAGRYHRANVLSNSNQKAKAKVFQTVHDLVKPPLLTPTQLRRNPINLFLTFCIYCRTCHVWQQSCQNYRRSSNYHRQYQLSRKKDGEREFYLLPQQQFSSVMNYVKFTTVMMGSIALKRYLEDQKVLPANIWWLKKKDFLTGLWLTRK